jgi:hypothetical protein
MYFKNFWYYKDYHVIRAGLEYLAPKKGNDFWRKEEMGWIDRPSECYTDVTKCFQTLSPTPDGVKDTYLNIDYTHNGKRYRYVTSNLETSWPPNDNEELTFRMATQSIMLLDTNKVPVRDVTHEIERCMGPRKNFHGEDVPVEKLMGWDDYEFVEHKNILGQEKIIHRTSSCLELL